MNKGRVGEERGGKEMDRCPLTLPPLQKCGVMTCKDCQEVARSTLVKEIELKMACCTGVFVVELRYLRLCMYLCMHLPLIVTLVITFPLDQVL
jgi:hypothetical protein